MPRKGDKPGKGKYTCLYCGLELEVEGEEEELPGCPACHNAVFY